MITNPTLKKLIRKPIPDDGRWIIPPQYHEYLEEEALAKAEADMRARAEDEMNKLKEMVEYYKEKLLRGES